MRLEQVSKHCYAALNDKNRLCDSNSGLIASGGGVVIDTQCDLAHARKMIDLFSSVTSQPPERVVNTHEDADHVWGNQLFPDAEIVGHRCLPERMKEVADPGNIQRLTRASKGLFTGWLLKLTKPALAAVGRQLLEDYDFAGIKLTPPNSLFDDQLNWDLDGLAVRAIHVGPGHQQGDTIVHVPDEGVVFAGDVVFHECTPMGWSGTFEQWLGAIDRVRQLGAPTVVPGHGPVCSLEQLDKLSEYLVYVRDESKRCFEANLPAVDAAKQIELGPYEQWRSPARIAMSVERAYRELRGDDPNAPWDVAQVFSTIYAVAQSRGFELDF